MRVSLRETGPRLFDARARLRQIGLRQETVIDVGGDVIELLAQIGERMLLRILDRARQHHVAVAKGDFFDLFAARDVAGELSQAIRDAGAVAVGAETAEVARVESGHPLFHTDMTEETIPLEAGIEDRSISLTKGCYVGQEVIIRVLHRGHGRVAKKLVGLVLSEGRPPDTGAEVQSGEAKAIGRVTSASWSPRLGHAVALAYVHRDFLTPGTSVRIAGREALVSALPFHQ